IIWNRIWAGMKLQMDATLQYAKGSEEEGWWPRVESEDKSIESEYNTYRYKGLPPGAIANPGLEALKAAYNPAQTKCMFYIHDKKRRIHCAETYEEHKKNIEKYL
ncbi:MAG: endolytic transglycosylase MltG, partial [Candidatus Paceibacteria bacterium]